MEIIRGYIISNHEKSINITLEPHHNALINPPNPTSSAADTNTKYLVHPRAAQEIIHHIQITPLRIDD